LGEAGKTISACSKAQCPGKWTERAGTIFEIHTGGKRQVAGGNRLRFVLAGIMALVLLKLVGKRNKGGGLKSGGEAQCWKKREKGMGKRYSGEK